MMCMCKYDKMCLPVQQQVFAAQMPGTAVNDFAPRKTPGEQLREDGILYVSDICYGEKYPNSYLDLWYTDGDRSKKRPTLIYIHGGGFIFGDKIIGDPLAAGGESDADFYAEIARQGFNVVSVNYALAPEYRFPVQVEQVDEMLSYLTNHANALGLDMGRAFLGGGSAGAILSEIYGTVLTNHDYAVRLGVTPSVRKEQIRGLLIDEAALSTRHFVEAMNAMLCCWMGADDLTDPEMERTMNPVHWIDENYIPSFINSSNMDVWFLDSAQDLAERLKDIGVAHELFYRGPEFGPLEHGYMQRFKSNKCARECLEHMLAFAKSQL